LYLSNVSVTERTLGHRYLHDAWDAQWYSQYPSKHPNEFVVTDHHLYRCFTEDDRKSTGDQHAQILSQQFRSTFETWSKNSNRSLIVGEFSAALDQQSFPKGCNDTEKDRHRRVFLQAQLGLFEEFCAGWYFWTLKKGNGWDAGWSAKDAATAEILPGWVGGKVLKPDLNHSEKASRLQQAMGKSRAQSTTTQSANTHAPRRCPYWILGFTTGSERT